MVDPGRWLSASGDRFTIGATDYRIMLEKDDDEGGSSPWPGARAVLVEQLDEETFTNVQHVWDPVTAGLTDDLRSVRACPDDTNPFHVHVYPHIAKNALYHGLLDFTPTIPGLVKLNGVLTRL